MHGVSLLFFQGPNVQLALWAVSLVSLYTSALGDKKMCA